MTTIHHCLQCEREILMNDDAQICVECGGRNTLTTREIMRLEGDKLDRHIRIGVNLLWITGALVFAYALFTGV